MKGLGVDASYHKANRARVLAEDIIRGTAEEGYSQLHSWLHMLKEVNPGTHTAIITSSENRFKYCFWALGACIRVVPRLRKVTLCFSNFIVCLDYIIRPGGYNAIG